MAKELAAMAVMPNGATMTVVMICAPQMTACSKPIGRLMRTAFFSVVRMGKWCVPCHSWIFSPDDRVKRCHDVRHAATHSANPVPRAAPSTPNPAPGSWRDSVPRESSRSGKMRKKLNTTSSAHISTPAVLGTRMLPLQRSMPPARKFSWRTGRKSENIRK